MSCLSNKLAFILQAPHTRHKVPEYRDIICSWFQSFLRFERESYQWYAIIRSSNYESILQARQIAQRLLPSKKPSYSSYVLEVQSDRIIRLRVETMSN